jgi:hypothetical protein
MSTAIPTASAKFLPLVTSAIEECFRTLLSHKHLYQSVELDLSFIQKVSKEIIKEVDRSPPLAAMLSGTKIPTMSDVQHAGNHEVKRPWEPNNTTLPGARPVGDPYVTFHLPTIHCLCSHCDVMWPFNPAYEGTTTVTDEGNPSNQWFFLGYQCQSCKSVPIRFLVRREGIKLRLSGRDPIETYPVPKFLPKSIRKFYGNAQIAHNAGQTLAGLFLLRVFIEQFWRTEITEVKKLLADNPRATGEMLGQAYNSSLPVEFKERFPSLAQIYGKLSEAIHSADDNAELFQDSCAKVVKHFDARRLFELC